MPYQNSEETKFQKFAAVLKLLEQRGHLYIDGVYETQKSQLTVYCPLHNEYFETTFNNYRRSRVGINWCAKARKILSLQGRASSKETIEKMRIAGQNRPPRAREGENSDKPGDCGDVVQNIVNGKKLFV